MGRLQFCWGLYSSPSNVCLREASKVLGDLPLKGLLKGVLWFQVFPGHVPALLLLGKCGALRSNHPE